jgi:rhodanese-related sulfurtransferase/DNA-binding transcriptional ArsR family regulator
MSTAHRRFKDEVYENLARIGKAVSAPKRLELLDLLAQAPRTVEDLAGQAAMSIANTSQHLQVLRAARLVESQKLGLHVEYRLADAGVSSFFVTLRGLGQSRLEELEDVRRTYLESRGAMEPVTSDALLARVRSGEVTLLDVRPAEEHRAGHIPGAISMPVEELEARLRELPSDRTVVAYCRGPFCVMAVDAVKVLRKGGFDAHHLELGVADWQARGGRVARAKEARP